MTATARRSVPPMLLLLALLATSLGRGWTGTAAAADEPRPAGASLLTGRGASRAPVARQASPAAPQAAGARFATRDTTDTTAAPVPSGRDTVAPMPPPVPAQRARAPRDTGERVRSQPAPRIALPVTLASLVRPVALPAARDTGEPVREPLRRSAGRPLTAAIDAQLARQAARSGPGNPDDPILLELTLGRIASRTVEGYRVGEHALVPLTAFLELAELRVLRRPDGRIETTIQPGNVPVVLDPASRELKVGGHRQTLGPADLILGDRDLYLNTDVLGRMLGIEWDVSWPDLQVAVVDPTPLPIARRIRREAVLRARTSHASQAAFTGLQLGVDRTGVTGMVLDYSVLTPTDGIGAGAYASTLGLDLLGGSFALGVQSQGNDGRDPRVDASWTGIWRESPYLSQLRVGDGFATGPRGRNLRGVSLSNSPYVRPATLGTLPFTGQLGQGWTVEAYRGGRLIGFDSVNALGQFSFDVPIQYGENPVDFVAYGPFGEVQEFNRTYRAQTDGLPARQFEYGLSLGECRTERCSATGNVDLRYGLSTRWTLRAGVDQFWRDSLQTLSHPYVGAVGALTNSVLVEAEAVQHATLRGAMRFEPSVNLQLGVEANRFARGVQAPILTPDGRRSQLTLSAFLRPWSALGGTYFDGSLDHIQNRIGTLTSARIGASTQAGGIRLLPAVRLQEQRGAGPVQHQTFLGLNAFILPQPSLGSFLGRVTGRGGIEVQPGQGTTSASAYLSRSVTRGLRAEIGTSWFRGMAGPQFSLLVAAELPTVRSYTTVTTGGGQAARGTQYVTGAAIYNPARGGVDFSGTPGLARGGVTGRVFLDLNGNGRFDRGEEPLPNVRVIVGSVYAMSDADGTYRVWDLLPYEPTEVTVDSLSLGSPLWTPAYATAMVEPSPNRYRSLDVPVLAGGVVEGQLLTRTGQPVAGGTLVFRHPASGEQRLVRTFNDGTFYILGVRPGAWEVTVDRQCLEALKASAPKQDFRLESRRDGATLSGLTIRLQ